MKNKFIQGKNIYLRGLQEEDLKGNYIRWLNDAEVCKYNSHHIFPYNYQEGINFIRSVKGIKTHLVLAIILKKNNLHIGNISLQNINYINRSAEFAILIGEKDYWGKGYAKEASVLIINHGFNELNLHRIYCGTANNNISMKKLARYIGMVKEGRRREALYKHGYFVDIIEYGLLRNEFLAKFRDWLPY